MTSRAEYLTDRLFNNILKYYTTVLDYVRYIQIWQNKLWRPKFQHNLLRNSKRLFFIGPRCRRHRGGKFSLRHRPMKVVIAFADVRDAVPEFISAGLRRRIEFDLGRCSRGRISDYLTACDRSVQAFVAARWKVLIGDNSLRHSSLSRDFRFWKFYPRRYDRSAESYKCRSTSWALRQNQTTCY